MATLIMEKKWEEEAHWDAEKGLRPQDQLAGQIGALALVYGLIIVALVFALPL